MAETKSTRRIEVVVTGNGADQLKGITREMGNLNKQVKGISGVMGGLSTITRSFFALAAGNQVFQMSDSIQNLESKLKVLHRTTQEVDTAFGELQKAAIATHSTMADLGTMYTRVGMATKNTGINSKQLMDLTIALRNSFRISGATMAESAATTIQLAQSFSQGTLRGQELRSVLQQNATVADLLRQKYGADLFKKAEEGMISAVEVMKLILENSDKINVQADKIALTFGDTLAIAMDKVSVKLYEVVKQTGATEKFATVVLALANNIDVLAASIAALFLVLKGGAILAAIGKGLMAIAAAYVFVTTSVVAAGAAVIAFIGFLGALFFNLGGVQDRVKIFANEVLLEFKKLANSASQSLNIELFSKGSLEDTVKNIADAREALAKRYATTEKSKPKTSTSTDLSNLKETAKTAEKFFAINQSFERGKISIEEYAHALAKLKVGFKDAEIAKGTKDIFEGRKQTRLAGIEMLNAQFSEAAITASDFAYSIEQIQFEELNDKMLQGKITLSEYNAELNKLESHFSVTGGIRVGAEEYIKSIGTLGEQIADATKAAFSGLEQGMTDFLQKGSMDWKKFSQDILDDLARIFIRTQLIKPLAEGVGAFDFAGMFGGSAAGGGSGVDGTSLSAIGSRILPHAKGGIVNTPTLFNMNKTGLTGESGPEAIIPLRRSSDGSLGVASAGGGSNVVVNITNNSGSEITQKESTDSGGNRTLDILIESKVKSVIAKGSFDKQMGMAYGITRKGS